MHQAIKKVRLYELVAKQLKSAIVSGEYPAGGSLPPENALATHFRVSRTAIREAMIVLQEMGFVSISPGRETIVLKNSEPTMEEHLYELLEKEDVIELVELRQGLEIGAVVLATRRCTPKDHKELKNIFKRLEQKVIQKKIGTEEDYKFHLKIIEMTRNSLYLNIMTAISKRFYDALREARLHTQKKEGGPEEVLSEHEFILKAIISKNEKEAAVAMRMHLDKAFGRILEVYGTNSDPVINPDSVNK